MKFLIPLFLLLSASFSTGYAKQTEVNSTKEVFVQAEGAQIFCRVMGKGDPIVVIHGGPGMTHDYFLPHMTKLAENNLVIFYDQRACGLSTGEINPQSMQIDVFLRDLECIRKSFGFKKMTLLGHSWGGFLAMKYAMAHPESVDKLILSNTMPASSQGMALFAKEYECRMAPYQEEIKKIQEKPAFLEGSPELVESYYQVMLKRYCHHPEKAFLLNLRAEPKASLNGFKVNEAFSQALFVASFDFHDCLKALKVPTLVIHGKSDPIPSITAQRVFESIPSSSYVILKDCGHFPFVEVPDLYFHHLNSFLKRE